MSSSLFLCSSGVRHASLPAPLRQLSRHAARLPPATAAFVSPSLHRSPPLQWTGSGVRMISSCFVPKRRRRRNGSIDASLFGVGAPEALVIGVVALLVFGPKGLAEVARNLGKTLRAFQPTIRELQDVSRDFRSTLEREIGLDEDPPSTSYRPPPTNTSQQPAADPPTNSSQQPAANPPTNTSQQPAADPVLDVEPETTVPYTSDELMKVTQQQLAASAIAAWNAKQAEEEAAAATTPSQSSEAAAATTPSQSSEAALSGVSDGPGAVTEESNSSNTENAKPRDEA